MEGGVFLAEVRLIVTLYDKFNFLGTFRTLVSDLADFGFIEFNDRTTSVIVTPGPNFRPGDAVRLWSERNFQGRFITLPPGQYNDLRRFDFQDQASSLRIVTGAPTLIVNDERRLSAQYTLEIIPPSGTTLVAVEENRVTGSTATGMFVGDTGVRVTGTFADQVVVAIRNPNGTIGRAIGTVTLPFSVNLNFQELAGIPKNTLQISTRVSNISSIFSSPVNNIFNKTIQFTLNTTISRRATTFAAIQGELVEEGETVEVAEIYQVHVR